MFTPQRLSAERNTSDSDSVGVSAGENSRENGETEAHSDILTQDSPSKLLIDFCRHQECVGFQSVSLVFSA